MEIPLLLFSFSAEHFCFRITGMLKSKIQPVSDILNQHSCREVTEMFANIPSFWNSCFSNKGYLKAWAT